MKTKIKQSHIKPSGVDWIGDIPEGWIVSKFKANFVANTERVKDHPTIDTPLSISGYRGVEPRDVDSMEGQLPSEDVGNYRIVRVGQLAVNTMWLNYAGLGVSNYEGYVSPAYMSYKIKNPNLNSHFVHHLMRSPLYVQKYSSLLYGVRPNSLQVKSYDFEKIEIIVPPPDMQKRIADFLDERTSKIDQLIEKKQKLIEAHKEKRETLVINTVTKGLNPKRKLKESHVDWIGEVPREWEITKLKAIFAYHSGGVWGEPEMEDENDMVCVRVADFDFDNLSISRDKLTIRNIYPDLLHRRLTTGDILLEKSGGGEKTSVGRAVLFNLKEKSVCSNFIEKFAVKSGENSSYIAYVMAAMYFSRTNTKSIKQTTGIQNLDINHYLQEMIPYPPSNEQKEIVDFLDVKSATINALIAKTFQQLEKLQEYRASLIYSAVTGKIEV